MCLGIFARAVGRDEGETRLQRRGTLCGTVTVLVMHAVPRAIPGGRLLRRDPVHSPVWRSPRRPLPGGCSAALSGVDFVDRGPLVMSMDGHAASHWGMDRPGIRAAASWPPPTEWPGLPGTAGLRRCLRAGSLRPRCPTECAGTTPRGQPRPGRRPFRAPHTARAAGTARPPLWPPRPPRGAWAWAGQPSQERCFCDEAGGAWGMHQQKALSVPQGGPGEHPASRCAPDLGGGGDGVEASRMRRGTPGRAGSGGGHSLQLELACRAATALTRAAMFHVKRHFTMAHLPGGHGRVCSDGGCFT